MTREGREKAIEEMTSDVRFAMRVPICDDSGKICGERITTSTSIISERLLNLGYRKEEEVWKEAAREIINYIKGLIVEPFYSVEICEQDLRHIAKKFGVEVGE